jgi:phage terminase large subunit-like protein
VSRPGREAGMKNGQTLRAPKVRHRNHACHDFFTASLTRRDASHGITLGTLNPLSVLPRPSSWLEQPPRYSGAVAR